FTFNDPLYNAFQAAEYSTTLGSSTNFPMTDAVTPSIWIDGRALFVASVHLSYQFNVEFPTFRDATHPNGFFFQSTLELDLTDNTCYANNGFVVTFNCSLADQSGDNFEWTIEYSPSNNYFTSTELYLDGSLVHSWDSQTIFGCSSCASMKDTCAQSVWVGWGQSFSDGSLLQDGSYANFYDGQGSMQLGGMSLFNLGPGGTSFTVTRETSNVQFTTPTYSNGVFSQTYYAGTVAQVLDGYSACSGSQINNPSYVIGIPDGHSAEYNALNSGGCAQTSTSFGGTPAAYSGNLAIYGYSYGLSSFVDIYCGTALVFSGSWSTSDSDQPAWIDIGLVSDCQGVTVDALYQSHVYVNALSLYN
ncbi:MAG: hypothetical protein ACREBS_06435, partial [Nitrososphaerales archaeon]